MTPAVRRFDPEDALAVGRVFYRAVHEGAAGFYNEAERHAWAPRQPDAATWMARLEGLIAFVSDGPDGILGFMALRPDGYLDLAYIQPEAMGTGVAGSLYARIEAEAVDLRLRQLTTDASHLAKRFFLKRGWVQVRAQMVERLGVRLQNFCMEKQL